MTSLPEHFIDFWHKSGFAPAEKTFLLAVSGGIDSVVMADLFFNAGMQCTIAHCNFQLRGSDSDEDELFVQQLAIKYNYKFFKKKFDTIRFAEEKSISSQMAARQLRYEWFNELVDKYDFAGIAVAHHADDVAETMLLNLVKGTGLSGMHGIKTKNGNVFRPLLFSSRKEIEAYAEQHDLLWREDASNQETYYQRNKIRHQVLPLLSEINPSVTSAFIQHADFMNAYETLLNKYIGLEQASMVDRLFNDELITIDLEKLNSSPSPGILLFHFLRDFGANASECESILSNSSPGAEFKLDGYRLVHDRYHLVLIKNQFEDNTIYQVGENTSDTPLKFGNIQMSVINQFDYSTLIHAPGFSDKSSAWIDSSAIKFPLKVRKWQKGDYFHPLGMQGKKLLSDYFTDEKFSVIMKEMVYLLCSGDEVVWLMGHRIDDRFKLTGSTRNCIRFKFIPK